MNSAEKDYRIVLLLALGLIAAVMLVFGYGDQRNISQNLYVHMLKERVERSQIKQGRA